MEYQQVVDALREAVDEGDGSWRLGKATLTDDYERGEQKLALTLTRSVNGQGNLPLDEAGE